MKSIGGRPPKFDEPSRPVTLTLPESTLRDLQCVHEDRSHAIVKLAKGAAGRGRASRAVVELVDITPEMGVIIVGPSAALRTIPFLHLVEVAPSRFLLAIQPGNDFKALEIAILDMLDDDSDVVARERELLKSLLEKIRHLRKGDRISVAEILLVKMGAKSATVACQMASLAMLQLG